MTTATIKINNDKLEAFSPYHPDLPSKAKKLGGKWDAYSKCWKFDVQDLELVTDLYSKVYGAVDSPTIKQPVKLVTVKLESLQKDSSYQSGLYIGGRCIGSATGRDSGARQGEGIVFHTGSITSGGSVKNWRTILNEGSVFEIRNFPESKIAEIDLDTYKILEVTTPTSSKELLEKEKEKLLARLAEIDKELNN